MSILVSEVALKVFHDILSDGSNRACLLTLLTSLSGSIVFPYPNLHRMQFFWRGTIPHIQAVVNYLFHIITDRILLYDTTRMHWYKWRVLSEVFHLLFEWSFLVDYWFAEGLLLLLVMQNHLIDDGVPMTMECFWLVALLAWPIQMKSIGTW